MAFRLPKFNLTCSVWNNLDPNSLTPPPPLILAFPQICQLRFPRGYNLPDLYLPGLPMGLLLPKLTDVRGATPLQPFPSIVEVPAHSGRFYQALFVDDVAKGFPNEHRIALIVQLSGISGWWTYPLP